MSQRRLGNFILDYTKAVNSMSESPHAFNMWSAISVVGSAMKKRCWIERGLYKIYPNQYIVLVAPPGVGKGAAMHPALSFVKGPAQKLVNFMSDRITAPKIIENLAAGFTTTSVVNGIPVQGNEASCCIQATELSTFLGSSDWMLSFLCDAWDRGEFDYSTKNKGSVTVTGMCVSLLGACVPEFIQTINKDRATAINGGFTARTIFVFAREKSKSIVWPQGFDHPSMHKLQADLTHDIQQIAKLGGEFTFEPLARVEFERFYTAIRHEDDDTEVVTHFKSREANHVLKVAMAFSAASRDDLIITPQIIKASVALVAQVRQTLNIIFRGVGDSPLAEASARIQTYIERKGMCSRTEILKDNYRHIISEDLDRVLLTLESIQIIERYTQNGKHYWKHATKGISGVKSATNGFHP